MPTCRLDTANCANHARAHPELVYTEPGARPPTWGKIPATGEFGGTPCGALTLLGGWGSPARDRIWLPDWRVQPQCVVYLAPSSSGPGRRPLKAVARVQIPLGLHGFQQVRGPGADHGGRALIICHWLVTGFLPHGATESAKK